MSLIVLLLIFMVVIESLYLYVVSKSSSLYQEALLRFIRHVRDEERYGIGVSNELFTVYLKAIDVCKKTGLDPETGLFD